MRPARHVTRALVLFALAGGCNAIFGLDAREPFPCPPGEPVNCYTGPAGTEGVGLCEPGMAMCNADGTALGECEGEVTPATETCDGDGDALDEDCDGETNESELVEDCNVLGDEDCDGVGCADPIWSAIYGDASIQAPTSIATDPMGNVFVCGVFEGNIKFGDTSLISAGAADIFLVKLDSAGQPMWSKRFGDATSQFPCELAIDTTGNVVIVGGFQGSIDFGGGILVSAGAFDSFVAKFAASGAHLWSKRYGDVGGGILAPPIYVAVDSSGDVVVAGGFQGAIDFGNGEMIATGGSDVFLAKLAGANASALWSKRFGDNLAQSARGVAIDGSGSVVILGSFTGSLELGGDILSPVNANGVDTFVARFDGQGNHDWSKSFGVSGEHLPTAIKVDSSGAAMIAGTFSESITFGASTLTSAGGNDIFFAKLRPSDGTTQWSKRFGTSSDDSITDIAVDASDNMLIAGTTDGAVDFGGGPLLSAGLPDIVIAKLDPLGGHLWSKRFGDSSGQYSPYVATASSNEVLLTCQADGTVDFGGEPLASAGTDVVIAKFAP